MIDTRVGSQSPEDFVGVEAIKFEDIEWARANLRGKGFGTRNNTYCYV